MNELYLIKLLYNHNYFNKYSNYIKDIIKNNKDLYTIYLCLEKLHDKYERDISHVELALFVLVNCPEKSKDNLSFLLKEIEQTKIEDTAFEDILNIVIQKQIAYDVALLALEVSEGRKEYDSLLTATKNLVTNPQATQLEQSIVTTTLQDLYNDTTETTGLRWRLSTLNRMLGSLRKGNFGIVFARPETGKTTFLVSEVSYFAKQLYERKLKDPEQHVGPILWFNNEEAGKQVITRFYQGTLGATRDELFRSINENEIRFRELGGDMVTIYDNPAIHRKQVEILCNKYQPSCIIFDQGDKIKGFSNDREDLRLGEIYIWCRELAKTYCPVISVCQADVSGEGKKWLTMENVANAKTSKQAEADWILGIGKTHNVVEEYMRFLHLSKNKLPGDFDTEPNLRHGREVVNILPDICRYQDLYAT